MKLSHLVILALACLTPSIRADVLTVGLNEQHATIQAAVDAAVDGDVLLLMDETFIAGAVINNKSLSLVAETGAAPTIRGVILVENLAVDKTCLISGINFKTNISQITGLNLVSNEGAVFVEGCAILGRHLDAGTSVTSCDSVTIVRCRLQGFAGFDCADAKYCSAGPGFAGLSVRSSNVSISGCFVKGGRGGSFTGDSSFAGFPANGGSGGHAIYAENSDVFITDSTLVRGVGGSPNCSLSGCGSSGSGGAAIKIDSADTTIAQRDVDLTGSIVNFDDGVVETYPSAARRLISNALVREGESLALRFEGEPGDSASLWISFDAGWLKMPDRQGVFALGVPLVLGDGVNVGVLPASGSLTVPLTIPHLVGLDDLRVFMQGVFVSPVDGVLLGSSTATVVLSAGL